MSETRQYKGMIEGWKTFHRYERDGDENSWLGWCATKDGKEVRAVTVGWLRYEIQQAERGQET